jgi:DNA-binding response OmpR family regulator
MAIQPDRSSPSQSRKLPGDECRVLIAEDYVDLARVVAMLLRRLGFDVRLAHDGASVLAIARQFRPHFLLLDIRLPDIGGYKLAETLRGDAALKGMKIIGISAYRPVSQPGLPMNANFDHYLTKPFDFEALMSLLKLR